MKSYPSIPTIGTHLISSGRKLPFDLAKENWIGFAKLDGSLIRVEWMYKKGFCKFGRKNGLLDDSNPILLEAPEVIKKDYNFLEIVFREFGWTKVIAFFEFLGKNSFAGVHKKEKHSTYLIDLAIDKKGLINPKELAIMDVVGGAKIVHQGPITRETIQNIYDGTYKNVSPEGVVFKRNTRKGTREMFKSKTSAWYKKLEQRCNGDNKLFDELK